MTLSVLGSWIVRLILAVLVFFLVTLWPLPQLLAALTLAVPHVMLVLLGLLLGAAVLFGPFWWPAVTRPRAVPPR